MSATTESVAAVGLRVTPYRANDALAVRLRPEERAAFAGIDLPAVWHQYETAGPGWTLRIDDEVIGCAGLMLAVPGRACAWLLRGDRLEAHALTAVKAIRACFAQAVTEYRLVRVEFTVLDGFTQGQRFAEWLGFTRERDGLAQRAAATDADLVRYEMVAPR